MNPNEEAPKAAEEYNEGYEGQKNEANLESHMIEGENLDNLFEEFKVKYPGRDLIIARKNAGKYIVKTGTYINVNITQNVK